MTIEGSDDPGRAFHARKRLRQCATRAGGAFDLALAPSINCRETLPEMNDAAEADPGQQSLFVVVAEALDPARAAEDPIRGGGYPDGSAGNPRKHA